jgi:hypothetical protein
LDILGRQINEFVKRARAAKVHAHIISHLKKEMPALMGKAKAQQKLLDGLDEHFAKVVADPVGLACIAHPCTYSVSESELPGPEGAAPAAR